jgi:hypothetical protein
MEENMNSVFGEKELKHGRQESRLVFKAWCVVKYQGLYLYPYFTDCSVSIENFGLAFPIHPPPHPPWLYSP